MYVCLYSYSISCLIGTLARQLYAIVTAHPIAQNEGGYMFTLFDEHGSEGFFDQRSLYDNVKYD